MSRKLNKEKLQSRKRSTMPMKESLQDIEPMLWHDDVLSGASKIPTNSFSGERSSIAREDEE